MDRQQLALEYPVDAFDKVMEEAGEVLQAMGKYKRFGPDSFSPYDNDQLSNHETLLTELYDLYDAVEVLINNLSGNT